MLLVSVDDVIASMGLSSALKDDLTATITSTIQKAQARLCNTLESPLEPLSCVDKVHLNSDLYAGVSPNGMLKVKLTNLFVDSGSVKATVSSSVGGVSTTVKPLLVNAQQGEVFFPLDLDGQYVTLNYYSGMDAETVPADIKEALLLYTAMIFSTTQPSPEGKVSGSNPIDTLAAESVAKYKKVSDFSFRPFYHTKEAQ